MSSHLPVPDLKPLEQTRQRLFQLTNALTTLQNSIHNPIDGRNPLPPWPTLQSHTTLLSSHLSALTTHLQHPTTTAALASLNAYPLPAFPGSTEEGTLFALLRKKFEPGVEGWVEAGRARGGEVPGMGGGDGEGDGIEGLWGWAALEANRLAREREWMGNKWSAEERRDMGLGSDDEDEDDDDEEDDEDEEMEDGNDAGSGPSKKQGVVAKREAGGKMMDMEDILRFMSRGVIPKTR